MTLTTKKLSVIIPCYNESENIRELYERLIKILEKVTTQHEIIFVDNNSTDDSEKIFRELAAKDQRVSVLFFSRNFGHSQYGYSAGTEQAVGDAVIWIEGDLQDPPEIIEKLVEKWLEGYEVVYGIRPKAVGAPFTRFARKTFYRLFQKFSYLDIPRDVGDFSLLDRKVVDIINAMPERSRFVRGLRAWIGFRHTGVVYERQDRKGGVTSNPSFRKNLWWAKKFMFSFSHAPLEFISSLAFWLVFISVGMTIMLLFFSISWPIYFFIVAAAWLFTINIAVLAVLAESIGIIFEEVKRRPKYIVREVLNNHRQIK
ncbi:glycosyltransferase family 2 protein [Patescibacteria group bacterium]